MHLDNLFTKRPGPDDVYEINVKDATDQDLQQISDQLGLALALPEMKRIQTYFNDRHRHPTDIELQALGQAWSEHCCYKSSKVPLKKYVFNVDEQRIIAREDAGVMDFTDDYYYCVALESHNHPSAIEPYGGAATGIGGIVRDVVCMGAQPIAFVDPLFFGPLNTPQNQLPKGVKHPRYLMKGVVDGIRDYGNRIGIPTVTGQVTFHDGYTGNCLVNVGCLGIMKKKELIHSWATAPGEVYIYVGGKTGRDGIHGVTFASAELTEKSEESSRSAVQVGDPITKEPVIHACLEANRKGLLQGFKDFGGGGLSCVSGELAYSNNLGAEIHLDDVPLKAEDLKPWEIWVSESQERMMLVAKPQHVQEILHICKQWDVPAAAVGHVIKDPAIRVFIHGQKILEMDLEFMTGGPIYDSCQRPYTIPQPAEQDTPVPQPKDLNKTLTKLLSSLNIASKDWVIRQYDHEVRANTVIKPLQGKLGSETHGDAAVIQPLEHSYKGIALTADINPRYMERHPYWGAASAIDEACRNLTAVGARPDSLLDCLNFGNPEKPERMGELYEACRGLGDMARALDLPFVSGNVSLYNQSTKTAVPPTPEIMGVGIADDIRHCTTSDLKAEGDSLYLIGRKTDNELGGSEYYALLKHNSGKVPRTDPALLKACINGLLTAMKSDLIAACHNPSEGGLAVALAEMTIGGDLGATIDLTSLGDLRSDLLMFSETNTRWLAEIHPDHQKDFETTLKEHHVPFTKIGTVTGNRLIITKGKKPLIDLPISTLRDSWKKTLWDYMG